MLLTALIVIILIGCWLNGRRRGLLGLVVSFVGYFLAWGLAHFGSQLVGPLLAGIFPPVGTTDGARIGGSLLAGAGSTFFIMAWPLWAFLAWSPAWSGGFCGG